MNDPTRIREASTADRPALEDCMAELQVFERSIESNRVEPEAIRGKYLDDLLCECSKNSGSILVAEQNGRVVGFVCILCRVDSQDIIEKEREHAYITDLVVLEPYRRAGIGAELMRAAESLAQSHGATRIQVGVLAANSGAHKLYQYLGYSDREIMLEKGIGGAPGSQTS
jgi:ribosomal protein S18 acetylase RimI-like enzyme